MKKKCKLIISCDHVIKEKIKGHWSPYEELLLCEPCWERINALTEKYQDNIPVKKLDFMFTVCQDCIRKTVSS